MISYRSMSLPLFALVAALAGCSGEAGASAGANTASANAALNTPAQVAPEGHRGFGMRPHGGPDFLVHAALHENINLTDAQRATLEGLVKKDPNSAPKPAFDATRSAKLAAAIRSNTVEQLQPQAPDTSARDAHLAEAAAKLQTLHDTLTPEQRTQLVDAIAKRGEEHKAHEGKHEHAQGERPRGFEGGPMHMLEGLDLTQAQKDAIKAKLDAERPAPPTDEQKAQWKAQHEQMRAQMQARLDSFKGNSFDAKAFVAPPANAAQMGPMRGGDHHMKFLAAVTSVLTPAQRETLAKRIEEGPRFEQRAPAPQGAPVAPQAPQAPVTK